MEYKPSRGLAGKAMNTRRANLMLLTRARQLAPRVVAGTPRRKGATAMSTSVESGHRSGSGDRPAARIVQRGRGTKGSPGAPVPANFRHHRDYMLRAIGGG